MRLNKIATDAWLLSFLLLISGCKESSSPEKASNSKQVAGSSFINSYKQPEPGRVIGANVPENPLPAGLINALDLSQVPGGAGCYYQFVPEPSDLKHSQGTHVFFSDL